jgi:hypothetical protein
MLDNRTTNLARSWLAAPLLAALLLAPAAHLCAQEKAAASILAVGDEFPTLDLEDQHGAGATIDRSTALVLFTRDMDGGGFVKETLAEGGAEKLAAAKAVYVSDVSGMPSMVRSMFALPSIRKRPYRVILDEKGAATASMPYQQGAVTMLTVEDSKITAVSFATSAAALAEKLRPAPAP